jgi:oxygen-independent coproporphyrinogen-3 oxidase
LYLHIPWCRSRCGYCDFNTYRLDRRDHDATRPYLAALGRELELAADQLGPRPVVTVYFGGGTPTLLGPADFAWLLTRVSDLFQLDPAAEITTEANPETVALEYLERLRQTGVNRLSLGMQSAVESVLAVLDREHRPGRAVEAVDWARRAGFDSVSLDLIYGTPGESTADWETSLAVGLAAGPDHLSAYALTVEPGTRLAARLGRGELDWPDPDDLADKYLQAEDRLARAGLPWYEISNWARPGAACRHNLAYWRSDDWWGVGAGAHSHVGGLRWWNHRLPRRYNDRLEAGLSPAQAGERLTDEQRRVERIMLDLRLASGLDPVWLTASERGRLGFPLAQGLMEVRPSATAGSRRGTAAEPVSDQVRVDPVVTVDGADRVRPGPVVTVDGSGQPAGPVETSGQSVGGPADPLRLSGRLVLTPAGRLRADGLVRDLLD